MSMTRKLNFYILSFWIIFSRIFDALSTFEHTRDLSKEANPLVSIMGLGWSPLLLIIASLTAYVIYAFYQYSFNTKNLAPQQKGLSFIDYSVYLYLGEVKHWSVFLYQIPKEKWRLHQYFGAVLAPCLVYAGILSTIMWLLIQYWNPYKDMHNPLLIYTLLVGGCLIIAYRFHRKSYQMYRAHH